MTATLNNDTVEARKMNIFSGHETNIAALLQTLGVYESHVPEYSSAVLVELIDLDGSPHVQVRDNSKSNHNNNNKNDN